MDRFRKRLGEAGQNGRVLIFDGAMGTQLHARGLGPGECPEQWNLDRPDDVAAIHRAYVKAGAEAVETNTFGASRPKLEHYGLGDRVRDINYRAVELAREAVGDRALVVGSIGPLGRLLAPLGPVSFDQAYEWFAEQARAFADAGADAAIVETMGDMAELRAAVIAVKSETQLPVIAHMTYNADGKSYTGTDPEVAVAVFEALGAEAIGANCSVGPRELLPVVERIVAHSSRPVSIMPNAGLPQLVDGSTVFPMGPEEYAGHAVRLVRAGARVVGGCCGTTPEHTRRLVEAVRALEKKLTVPDALGRTKPLVLASRNRVVRFEAENLPILIGEHINPTGKKQLTDDIVSGRFRVLRRLAKDQYARGMHVLDVNVGIPGTDEAAAMAAAVQMAQRAVPLPLALDSSTPGAIEAGLKHVVGKPLINSVSGEEERMATLLPAAKRYGAGVIVLTLGAGGIPQTAEERLAVARRVVSAAEDAGLRREDLLVDALCLPVGSQQEAVFETLRTIELVRQELGLPVMIGLGNVSHGMPNRELLDTVFMSLALDRGVAAAIVNANYDLLLNAIRASRVFLRRDENASEYLAAMAPTPVEHRVAEPERTSGSPAERASGRGSPVEPKSGCPSRSDSAPRQAGSLSVDELKARLRGAVLDGAGDDVVALVNSALEAGMAPMDILQGPLISAMEQVGELFGQGVVFLPELMQSATTVQRAFARLEPLLGTKRGEGKGTVLLATVHGDIHDIGKNICAILLENNGYRIVDLGRDVPAQDIVDAARGEGADLIGLSALMTTTMPEMARVIEALDEAGLNVPVMIGGAATTREYAERIGAAGWGRDAQQAVTEANRLIGDSSEEVKD